MKLDSDVKNTVMQGFSAVLEAITNGTFPISILDDFEYYYLNKFSGFLEAMKLDTPTKNSLSRGFKTIFEDFTYTAMDPSTVFSYGNTGFDLQGAWGPLFDKYEGFKLASGGTDEPGYTPSQTGFGTGTPIVKKNIPVKELIKQANAHIPVNLANADPTVPTERYNHSSFNTSMIFN